MSATGARSLIIQASFAVTAPPAAAKPAPAGAAGRGGVASPASVLRGPRPDLLPPTRGSGGPAPGSSASVQTATAPARPTSAASAMDAMRARAPRPELMPARPASVQRATSAGPATAAPVRPASAASAMDAIRARAPRPELLPARPAAVQRAVDAGRPASPRAAAVTLLGPQILQLSPGGEPLPSAVRHRMETLLGADLSEVRIHQGAQPAAIGAVAFTAGSDIYFAPGHYRPTEPAGQRLLTKQLTYVLQQRAGLARNPHGRGMVLVRDPALDAQAEQLGELASRPGVMQAKPLPAARGLFQVKTSVAGPGRQHLELYERGRAVGGADVVLDGQRAKLYNLRVDAEHRGRGGGEELVRAAAVASERIGKRTLALEADDDGSGKLLRWYQSQGFRPTGEGDDRKPAFEAPVRALKRP